MHRSRWIGITVRQWTEHLYGLRTVERRLQLEYGTDEGLAIETAPGAGFVVTMAIPLPANDKDFT